MTKREIVKRSIEELRFKSRMYHKFLEENKREYARDTKNDMQVILDFLWDIEIISLDEKRYLEKCFSLR